jgi:hypothetical protein
MSATTILPRDYTLYRLGYMSGTHENNIESLVSESVAPATSPALDRELQPAVAHFLLAAAYTSVSTLREMFGTSITTAAYEVDASFVGLETRRLLSITGGFAAQNRSVPCVVALFKSATMFLFPCSCLTDRLTTVRP